MKRLLLLHFLLILLVSVIVPVHASIRIQAIIDQNIYVVLDFEKINATIYNDIVQQGLFDVSTIPEAIRENFEQQNLTNAWCNYDPAQEIFGDSPNSIHVEFYLTGSDILNLTVNTETMTRNYRVRTDWRKFQVNLTNETRLDFTEHFAKPVSQWNQANYTLNDKKHPAYYHNSTIQSQIDPSFHFILPENARDFHAVQDTIIFEVPLSFEESLLNSPFLILAVLVVVDAIVLLYRRIRK